MEIVAALVGALGGLFLFQQLMRFNNNKKQAELESAVKKIEAKADNLVAANKEIDKATQDKVNAITEEQNNKLSTDQLVDWFNNRKH